MSGAGGLDRAKGAPAPVPASVDDDVPGAGSAAGPGPAAAGAPAADAGGARRLAELKASGDSLAHDLDRKLAGSEGRPANVSSLAAGRADAKPAKGSAYDRLPPPLKKALDDYRTGADWGGDLELIKAARAGNQDVVDALQDMLKPRADYPIQEGLGAISVLRQIGTPAAARAIAEAIPKMVDAKLEDVAAGALRDLGRTGALAAAASFPKASPSQQEALLPALAAKGSIREPAIQKALTAALASKDPALRLAAANAIADAGAAAPDGLRRLAAGALAQAALKDDVADTRWDAALKLIEVVKADPADPALLDALAKVARGSKSSNVLGAIAAAYTEGGVLKAARGDPAMRARVVKDLGALAGSLRAAKGRTDSVYEAIGQLGGPEARKLLLDQAKSKDPAARKEALKGLLAAADPDALGVILEMAVKDKAKDVRAAARDALQASAYFGTAADRRANLLKLREAAKGADAELKPAIDGAIATLAAGHTLADEPGSYEAIAKAYGAKPPDLAGVARGLEAAAPQDLELLASHLKSKGKSLEGLLDELQTGEPAGHARVLDAFAQNHGRASFWAEGGPAPDVYGDALVAHLKDAPDAVVRGFGQRNLNRATGAHEAGNPGHGAADVLAAIGTDAALETILESDKGASPPPTGWSRVKDIRERIETLPPERIDRIALRVMARNDDPAIDDAAAILLSRAGTPKGKETAARRFERVLREGTQAVDEARKDVEREIEKRRETLGELYAIRDLARRQPSLKEDVVERVSGAGGPVRLAKGELEHLDRLIAAEEGHITAAQQRQQALAEATVRLISDPDVERSLAVLPEADAAKLLDEVTAAVQGTDAGADYFRSKIGPSLEKPESSPLWEKAYGYAKKSKSYGLKLIERFSPELILQGELAYQKGLVKFLGLQGKGDVKVIEDALGAMKGADKQSRKTAEETLEKLGFKGALHQLDAVFAGVDLALAIKELTENPSARHALETASSTADLIEKLGPLAKNLPHLQKFAKIAGKAAKPIEAVLAYMDMGAAIDRQDKAGAVTSYMKVAGGVLQVAALGADASIIGAPLGAVLHVTGAVLTIAGHVGAWLWADSDKDKRLKTLAGKHGLGVET